MTEQSVPVATPRRTVDPFRERVHELRAETIREAAGRVVARHGLGGATMDAIADEAGVAKGTLYLYFRSRDELIEKAAAHALAGLNRQVAAALAGPGGFPAQLRALVDAVLAFFDAHRDFFRLSFAVGESGRRRGLERAAHPRFEEYLAHLTGWLDEARRRGEVVDQPGALPVAVVAGAIGGVLRRRFEAAEAAPPAAEEAARLTDLLLHGLAGRGDVRRGDPR